MLFFTVSMSGKGDYKVSKIFRAYKWLNFVKTFKLFIHLRQTLRIRKRLITFKDKRV